jgi:hypothetical protein
MGCFLGLSWLFFGGFVFVSFGPLAWLRGVVSQPFSWWGSFLVWWGFFRCGCFGSFPVLRGVFSQRSCFNKMRFCCSKKKEYSYIGLIAGNQPFYLSPQFLFLS